MDEIAGLIEQAHDLSLEVVLESHTLQEYEQARTTSADILAINNRDLHTLQLDLSVTGRILAAAGKDRPVIAASGVSSRLDVELLLAAGADAILVGTSLMQTSDPAGLLRSLRGVGPSGLR